MRNIAVRSTPIGIAIIAAATLLVACTPGAGPEGYPPPATSTPSESAVDGGYPAPVPAEGESTAAPMPSDPLEAGIEGLDGRTLLVGTDAEYPPFESIEDGQIVGFDPDLMRMICQLADCVAEFRSTAWDGIFAALSAGEFDVLMSAITILPEREAESGATFTVPYFSVGQVVLVRADEAEIAGVEGLADAVVGVQTGTTGDTAATADAGVAEENMRRFDSNALAVQALLNGDVDAVICDNPTAENYVAAHEGALKLAGEAFTVEDYGILVPNDSPEVLAALNAAIERLQADGMIDELADRWLGDAAPE